MAQASGLVYTFLTGGFACLGFGAALLAGEHIQDRMFPVEELFEVHELTVPNFMAGDNPVIQYKRDIRGHFVGEWTVEVKQVFETGTFSVCSGSGTSNYSPDAILSLYPTLNWFIGKDCKLTEGSYTLLAHWQIDRDLPFTQDVSFSSNGFRVTPAEK